MTIISHLVLEFSIPHLGLHISIVKSVSYQELLILFHLQSELDKHCHSEIFMAQTML